MKYIRVNRRGRVLEILPSNPFTWMPGVDRKPSAQYLASCRSVEDNVEVERGWIEQPGGSFAPPEITANETAFSPMSFSAETEISALTVGSDQKTVKTSPLKLKVDNQRLYADGLLPRVIADSVNYLYIQFEFSPEWEEMKFALFYDDWYTTPTEVKLENDGCYVPNKFINTPGFEVSVYCVTGDGCLITTGRKKIPVGASGYKKSSIPQSPPPLLSTPIYSPTGDGHVQQLRVMDGMLEYTTDGKMWHTVNVGGTLTYLGDS